MVLCSNYFCSILLNFENTKTVFMRWVFGISYVQTIGHCINYVQTIGHCISYKLWYFTSLTNPFLFLLLFFLQSISAGFSYCDPGVTVFTHQTVLLFILKLLLNMKTT